MRYLIAIEPGDEKHAFGVNFPDMPGCISAGDTLDEALDNAREAASLWLEEALEDGAGLPRPMSFKEARAANPKWKDWIWSMVDVDPEMLSDKAERLNITLPAKVVRRLDVLTRKTGETRSGYIARLVLTNPL